eukprot:231598-Pelagomonas_calceolata.AAC.5
MELPDRHYPTNAVIGYQNDWTVSQKARTARPLFEASPREREAALAALSKKVAIRQARKDKHLLFEAIVQVISDPQHSSLALMHSTDTDRSTLNTIAVLNLALYSGSPSFALWLTKKVR